MFSKKVKIVNSAGFHARPASQFVAEAKKHQSKISVKNVDKGTEAPNAKSIILLLTLALACGTEVEITADGPDEVEAVEALVKLVESGFGEE